MTGMLLGFAAVLYDTIDMKGIFKSLIQQICHTDS